MKSSVSHQSSIHNNNNLKDTISFDKSTDRFTSNIGGMAGSGIGHGFHNISNPCEDTFLADADSKYLDSQLIIQCETHKSQAVFYSNQQQKYKCFKCLLQEQDLIYIDKKFKKEMEEYERIKRLAAEAIQSNIPKMSGMKIWKNSIRQIIMDVRSMFQRWVDTFTNQLINSLKDIEASKDLKDFTGEDRRLNQQLEGLRDKYVSIMKIFTLISNTSAEQKPHIIEQHRNQTKSLEAEIKKQDAFIVKQAARMKEAQIKTVAIDGLQLKLGQKYIAHFEKKLNHREKNGIKAGNQSIVSTNPISVMSKMDNNIGSATSTKSVAQPQFKSQNTVQNQTAPQSMKSMQTISQMPQIESSSRQNTVVQHSQHQGSQSQRSNTIKSSQTSSQRLTDSQSQHSQGQKTIVSQQTQRHTTVHQQQQPMHQTSSQMKHQPAQNLQDTLNLDVSEIRPQNHGNSHSNPLGVDPSLSLIPEMMEFSSTQKTMTHSQITRNKNYYEEEKGQNQNQKNSGYSQSQSLSNIDQSSISYRYRHKNQNSIYFLRSRSNEIYLLDFKVQKFVKEQIKSLTMIPTGFGSVQVTNGNIYLFGGQSQDKQVSKSCWEIDTNLNMIEKATMKTGRYNLAVTLMFDKFIFAIGGNTLKGTVTETVEVYDSSINTWYPVAPLQKERSNTTACVLAQRYIYVFPGQSSNSWSTIEFLDIGHSIDAKELKRAKWNLVNISNPDFNVTFAYGSVQISQTEILVFGGSKQNSFLLDTNVIQNMLKAKKDLKKQQNETPNILTTLKNSPLCIDAWFGYESDFMARIYGNYLYAIDQHAGNLHVYSLKDKQWNYSSLKELGLN
eukprot:403373339